MPARQNRSMTSVRSAPDPAGARPSMTSSPGLAVAAVARRLGVAPATLRTWDRRYGLGPSQHRAGSHRRYTDDDVARLVVMRRLTLDGVAPADAARAALAADEEELAREPWGYLLRRPRRRRRGRPRRRRARGRRRGARAGRRRARSCAPSRVASPARGAGPRPVGVREDPRPTRVSDVVDAAIAYDQRACARLLRIPTGGDPAAWWSDLVEPAMERLAERTVLRPGPGEVPEVVLANATLVALRDVHAGERGCDRGRRGAAPEPPEPHAADRPRLRGARRAATRWPRTRSPRRSPRTARWRGSSPGPRTCTARWRS